MRRTFVSAMVAVALAIAIGTPVLGFAPSVAAPLTARAAQASDGLEIMLQHPVEGRTFWYGGAVMPVVVLLTDNGNVVTDASVTLWVNGAPATGPGKVMVGNMFNNLGEGLYQYNLETKPFPAGPGSVPIMVEVMASAGGMTATLEFSMVLH